MSDLHLLIQGKNSEEDNNKVLSFLLIVIDYPWVNSQKFHSNHQDYCESRSG